MHENLLQATLQVNTSICSIFLAIITVSEEGREGERERETCNFMLYIMTRSKLTLTTFFLYLSVISPEPILEIDLCNKLMEKWIRAFTGKAFMYSIISLKLLRSCCVPVGPSIVLCNMKSTTYQHSTK